MSNFINEYVFNLEKDKAFNNSNEFYKMIKDKYKMERSPELYRRIINYQIKKYGSTLESYVDLHSTSELIKMGQKSRKRLYFRKKRGNKDE